MAKPLSPGPNFKTHPHLYRVWVNMKAKCDNPQHPQYPTIGGRDIVYAPEWGDFKNFAHWALNYCTLPIAEPSPESEPIGEINARGASAPESHYSVLVPQEQPVQPYAPPETKPLQQLSPAQKLLQQYAKQNEDKPDNIREMMVNYPNQAKPHVSITPKLHRIDRAKNYTPENCFWVMKGTQPSKRNPNKYKHKTLKTDLTGEGKITSATKFVRESDYPFITRNNVTFKFFGRLAYDVYDKYQHELPARKEHNIMGNPKEGEAIYNLANYLASCNINPNRPPQYQHNTYKALTLRFLDNGMAPLELALELGVPADDIAEIQIKEMLGLLIETASVSDHTLNTNRGYM